MTTTAQADSSRCDYALISRSVQMTGNSEHRGFWTSLPGVLTGLAAMLTAIVSLYVAMRPSPTPADPANAASRTSINIPDTPTAPTSKSSAATERFTGPMGPLEHGVSYSGGDMYDRPASSAEDCVQLCSNDDRCRAVTFIISQQRCWLKDRVNAPAQSGDMISAIKQP
jgi:hypothetical protein